MIDGILSFAIHQRWLVMIGVLAMAAFGAWNFTRLPIDAVPDIRLACVSARPRERISATPRSQRDARAA